MIDGYVRPVSIPLNLVNASFYVLCTLLYMPIHGCAYDLLIFPSGPYIYIYAYDRPSYTFLEPGALALAFIC